MAIDQNILNTKIGSQYLVDQLFPQLSEETKTVFMSVQTRTSLDDYSAEQNDTTAKKLWTDLLIDSICLLKINDKREKLYSDTKEIYNADLNDIKDFSSIRKISTYGIEDLKEYFSSFVDFESVLYGTGEYYRDHIHHVLQVWGLGIGLLWGPAPMKLKLSEGFDISTHMFHFQIEEDNARLISQTELWSMWAIIALCHDLGYPIEKASLINQKVKKIINHFGCLNFNELNFNFDILNTFIVEKYLNIISSKTVIEKNNPAMECKGKDCTDECSKNNTKNSTKIQHKYYDKFSKSLEDYQHGAFSGLLLFKMLTYFLETDFAPNKENLSCEDLRQFYIRKEILRAICGHTCPKIYHIDLNTISFLLIFCDELQEWGRPRFKEIKEKAASSEPEMKIKLFKTTEQTVKKTKVGPGSAKTKKELDKECVDETKNVKKIRTEASVEEKYLITLTDKELEKFEDIPIRKKFRNFLCLLRSAKDDSERNFNFKWEIIINKIKYLFEFDTNETAYNMLKTTKKEVGKDPEPFHLYGKD